MPCEDVSVEQKTTYEIDEMQYLIRTFLELNLTELIWTRLKDNWQSKIL